MPNLSSVIEVRQERRPCTVKINEYWCKKLGIEAKEATVEGMCLGFFQEIENAECAYPVAAIELRSGRVISVSVDTVTFTDTCNCRDNTLSFGEALHKTLSDFFEGKD